MQPFDDWMFIAPGVAQPDDHLIEEAFAQRQMSRGLFTRLSSYVRPYKRLACVNLAFTALAAASQLLGPKFIQWGIDRHLTGRADPAVAARGMLVVTALYLANLLFGWGVSVIQVRSAIEAGQKAMNDLRTEVFTHIQRLSLSYFDRTHQGRIISRADSDIDSLDRILTWGATQMLSSAATLIGVVVLMAQSDWRLFLAVCLVIPGLGAATHWFQKRVMEGYRKVREQTSRMTASLAENINGVRVVQACAREEVNVRRFREVNDEFARRALHVARVFHTYLPLVGLVSGLGTAIILGYGGWLGLRGELTAGELAAFVMYLGMFFGPIHTMGDLYNSLLSTAASAERIFQLLDTAPDVVDRPGAVALPRINGAVEFDAVRFRYASTPHDKWVLDDVSFKIDAGKTVALVGPTGSGKTSVVSLLARFYEPQIGSVKVDGVDVGGVTMESLRGQIGIVTQENFLFTGSVLENLRFGRPSATDDEVKAAAALLGTSSMIEALADGYETKVGERGGNLSAGQRQLLTITRAMVAEPRLLIFDEATSSVDQQSESVIQNALERLFERRTCFVIAHRLSTVRRADLILVLDGGRIVERGTHEQLMERGGRYAGLHHEFVRV